MKTAYPQIKGTCSIRLYSNIPFDNTYEHHSLISEVFKYNGTQLYSGTSSNGLAKERFLNRLKAGTTERYYPRYDLVGDFNFNFSNGLIANVTLELTPAQTNANYLRLTCGDDIYYYFITGISQNNFDTYTLSLELDVLMTYQDEFLEGMKDVPARCRRKHSHRFNSQGYPHCADFKNNEDAFLGIKPSVVSSKTDLVMKGGMELLSGVSWLYIAYEVESDLSGYLTQPYRFKECKHPVCIFCQPYNARVRLEYLDTSVGLSYGSLSNDVLKLIEQGKVHGSKILPFPPFYDEDAEVTIDSNGGYHIKSSHLVWHEYNPPTETHSYWEWTLDGGKTRICMYPDGTGHEQPSGYNDVNKNTLIVFSQDNCKYPHKDIALDGIAPQKPSVLTSRLKDPRLLFAPFRKYTIASPYANDYEFYPELVYGENNYTSNVFKFESSATAYIGDNNIVTYLSDNNYYKNYKDINIGLSSALNYTIPSGTNALDVFNSTQAQAFYQSKTASGITSGLTIAGGAGSVALGIAGMVGSLGLSTPASVGLIAGGVSAIGSGIASAVNVSKSTNAKIEDLRNTPDSFNVAGSNYTSDYARTSGNMPYVVIYECSKMVNESANDFFYEFGYAVARDCYFNDELKYDEDTNEVDNNLFGRTIFNYIQLNEDITNKINADIPHIVKQKLSSLFNNGITLWSFIRFGSLWTSTEYETGTYNVDKWFMKHNLDNTEYKVS